MPEFLQNIDLGGLTAIVLGCGVLCVAGFLLFFGLQIIGTILGTFVGFLEIFVGVLAGGPVAWCGCALLLMACGVCGVMAVLIANAIPACETNPIMFCRFLGY